MVNVEIEYFSIHRRGFSVWRFAGEGSGTRREGRRRERPSRLIVAGVRAPCSVPE